ncbi:30S ribosome-binding factor RbfA [Chlamydiota bacterium]
MRNERLKRMNELLKREASRIIAEDINDTRIAHFVTILHVKLSKDLKFAKLYCSIMGSGTEKQKRLQILESAAGFIQHKIAEKLDLRFTPHIRIIHDESIDESFHIAELLKHDEEQTSS